MLKTKYKSQRPITLWQIHFSESIFTWQRCKEFKIQNLITKMDNYVAKFIVNTNTKTPIKGALFSGKFAILTDLPSAL